ncbi:hypothetical protein HYC85_031741 [Camellia sinensis]|uniref:Uncharacterized protein n=1 Tax=Camellia sinensis TaxID=4442 RepID=A0A7J7FT57_CAMSI|nr:hypothetical protein HYC85_031741 [Camellia sinensis]
MSVTRRGITYGSVGSKTYKHISGTNLLVVPTKINYETPSNNPPINLATTIDKFL